MFNRIGQILLALALVAWALSEWLGARTPSSLHDAFSLLVDDVFQFVGDLTAFAALWVVVVLVLLSIGLLLIMVGQKKGPEA